jgi:signal transduction histidine kinase
MYVSEYPESELKQLVIAEGIQMAVGVPLVSKGRVVGALSLGSREVRVVRSDELALLAAIGQQTGLAVENAELYERAEETAVAAERNRLARDLHDAVTQTLFSASLIADVLPRMWKANPDEAMRRVEELRELTRGALAEMRTLLVELRPASLEEAPLEDLLRQLGEALIGRARVPVTFRVEGRCSPPSDVKIAFYRIAQEALNNVFKHAAANEVAVVLRCGAQGLALTVCDDGRGFDPSVVRADNFGLRIMRERAEAVGAELGIESEVGEGSQIHVRWPL